MKTHGNPTKTEEYGTAHKDATDVEGVVVVGYDPKADKYLAIEWNDKGTIWLVGGGREKGESYEEVAIRELKEETGYSNYEEQIQLGGPIISYYYNERKNLHRRSYSFAYLFIIDGETVGKQELEEHENFKVTWLDYDTLHKAIEETGGGVEHWLATLSKARDYILQSPTS